MRFLRALVGFIVREPLASALYVLLFLICLPFFLAIGGIWYAHMNDYFPLDRVPEDLKVSKTLHAAAEHWGFGPGGNEVELFIYELPAEVDKMIEQEGIDFFFREENERMREGELRKSFRYWKRTPVTITAERWTRKEVEGIYIYS